MNISNKLSMHLTFLLVLALVSAQPAQAFWQIDQRPQTLSIAKELSFRYETVRGEIEKPVEGVNAKLTKIHTDLKTWIINCAQLKLRVDSAQGTNLGQFESQLTTEALASAKKFDGIYADAIDLRIKLQTMIQSLQTARRIDYEMNSYQSEYTVLVGAVDNLQENLIGIERMMTDLVTDVRTTIPQLNAALLSRLKLNLIGQGLSDVETAINSVEDLLQTDQALDELTKPFKAEVRLFNKYVLEARYFGVADLGQKLAARCNNLNLAISGAPGHLNVKQSYLKATQNLCSSVAADTKSFAAEDPGAMVASSIHDLRLERLKNRCSQPNPGLAKCAMLSWMGRLSREQITAMEPATLRGLEALWNDAEGEKELMP